MVKTIRIKLLQEYYDAVERRVKNFEVRFSYFLREGAAAGGRGGALGRLARGVVGAAAFLPRAGSAPPPSPRPPRAAAPLRPRVRPPPPPPVSAVSPVVYVCNRSLFTSVTIVYNCNRVARTPVKYCWGNFGMLQ